MKTENFLPLTTLSSHYQVELSFFTDLNEIGLIEILTIDALPHVASGKINEIEKMIRLRHELEVNIEGIDVVFHLLQKIDALQTELTAVKNRLNLYEI